MFNDRDKLWRAAAVAAALIPLTPVPVRAVRLTGYLNENLRRKLERERRLFDGQPSGRGRRS